ncbi:lysozyme inhibitor LprI family protein [Bradyrhizobium liaoningense]|uniref:lysozyme inhibitor LprI family protein n=1 Tax=Bradyrhizobium liaoningense TaxID=43992 RepID=UPI001BA63250|nr:lysozyme inhibitor LprI family protein [Bradyrhizobium liaoningense]MBR0716024.1 DUF1311 domain-containing protein [Bradyrhizobium liaoningense]
MTKFSNGMSCFSVALLLALAGCGRADNDRIKACYERRSNAEQRDCLHDLYRTASAELEQIYRRSVDRATALEADARARNTWPPPSGNGPSSAERITASQKAWEAYRDAECWGVVGEPGGSGSRTWAYGCLAEKTFERIGELKVPYIQR